MKALLILAAMTVTAFAADIKVTWVKPETVRPTHYVVEYRPDTNVVVFPIPSLKVTAPATSVLLTGMREGVTYRITVRAVIVPTAPRGSGPFQVVEYPCAETRVRVPLTTDMPGALSAEIVSKPQP